MGDVGVKAQSTLQEVDDVLQALSNIETAAAPELAVIPGLSAIVPFLGLFKVVASGVDLVARARGEGVQPLAAAIAAVTDHNTPGAPNAFELGPDAPGPASAS